MQADERQQRDARREAGLPQRAELIPERLRDVLEPLERVGLAFSGGVDSAFLLYACASLGVDVRPYYVASQFQPAFELEDARRLAAMLDVELTVLELDILQHPDVTSNPPDRCYYGKQRIFRAILEAATADGCTLVLDGSNASDDASDRPGMRALAELEVRSPLREAGLVKTRIRQLSRDAGLFTWDKPAYACLATRVPTGTPIQAPILSRVEAAEAQLAQMGFSDLRVRVVGEIARLQLKADQMEDAIARREALLEALAPWFKEVVLDLEAR